MDTPFIRPCRHLLNFRYCLTLVDDIRKKTIGTSRSTVITGVVGLPVAGQFGRSDCIPGGVRTVPDIRSCTRYRRRADRTESAAAAGCRTGTVDR